jgi:predicted porin
MYKNSKKILSLAIAGIVAAPIAAQADVGVYGAVKVSIDSIKSGDESRALGVSSNSTRFGIKGSHELPNDLKAGFKAEFGFDASGETKELSTRNRYVSLGGNFGEVRVGNHDTPFKNVAKKIDIFDDTVGDRRAIIGVDATGSNKFNQRAKNAVIYISPKVFGLQFEALYSAANTGTATATATATDDNDKDLVSASLQYEISTLTLRAAYETQGQGNDVDDYTGIRVSANYKRDDLGLSALYENLDGGTNSPLSRSAYSVNATYTFDKTSLMMQAIMAGDADSGSDTDATNISAGVFHKHACLCGLYYYI